MCLKPYLTFIKSSIYLNVYFCNKEKKYEPLRVTYRMKCGYNPFSPFNPSTNINFPKLAENTLKIKSISTTKKLFNF